jgi:hypothetical protein
MSFQSFCVSSLLGTLTLILAPVFLQPATRSFLPSSTIPFFPSSFSNNYLGPTPAPAGILPGEFAEKIKGMPAFRNRIIHDYLPNEFDALKLFETLQTLDDFKAFSKYILAWLEGN